MLKYQTKKAFAQVCLARTSHGYRARFRMGHNQGNWAEQWSSSEIGRREEVLEAAFKEIIRFNELLISDTGSCVNLPQRKEAAKMIAWVRGLQNKISAIPA